MIPQERHHPDSTDRYLPQAGISSATLCRQKNRASSCIDHLCLIVALLSLLVNVACEGGATNKEFISLHSYDASLRYYPGRHWAKLSSPELAGWSSQSLERARQFSVSIHSDAVVVVYNGVIVTEWGKSELRMNIHSIRKSIMSAMYGIYSANKQIDITQTLKELGITDVNGLSDEESRATVRDLLSARSGVYHRAAYETDAMEKKRPLRGSHPPGTFWYYNNWDFNVLATIFNQETGKDFFRAFKEDIATPLQMEQFRLDDTTYHYEREHSLHPAYLFRMSALDLARFGLLYLRQGIWDGVSIIPDKWIEESTRLHSVFRPEKNRRRGYGYMWYVDENVYYAQGTGGQRVFVIPSRSLVVVHRVDSSSGKGVGARQIWQLLDMIIESGPPSSENRP